MKFNNQTGRPSLARGAIGARSIGTGSIVTIGTASSAAAGIGAAISRSDDGTDKTNSAVVTKKGRAVGASGGGGACGGATVACGDTTVASGDATVACGDATVACGDAVVGVSATSGT